MVAVHSHQLLDEVFFEREVEAVRRHGHRPGIAVLLMRKTEPIQNPGDGLAAQIETDYGRRERLARHAGGLQ
jgi:hypothetical protein